MKFLMLILLISINFSWATMEAQTKKLNKINEYLVNKYSSQKLGAIKKPQASGDITKSEFETQEAFVERQKRSKLDLIAYGLQVDKIKAKVQPKALNKALLTVYGKPQISNLRYIAELGQFIATLNYIDMPFNQTIAIKVDAKEAKRFKNTFVAIKVSTVFDLKDNKISVSKIKFKHQGKKYYGTFTDKFFAVSQPKLTLDKNYMQIEQENKQKQKEYMAQNDIYDNSLEKLLKNAATTPIDPKRWAIVIGVENYMFSANIAYSKRSAKLFSKVLHKSLGIPKDHIYTLIDEKATSSIIKTTLKKALRRVSNGDTVYFYYNGHGVPVPSENNEPYMLSADTEIEFVQDDKFFSLKNVYQILSKSKASSVIAFVDSCFSGGTDGKALLKGVAAARLVPKEVGFDREKMAIMTAGQGRQYSNGYDEKGHRLFSYYLMKNLIENSADVQTIYNNVYRDTKETSYKLYGDLRVQEPTLSGNMKLTLD